MIPDTELVDRAGHGDTQAYEELIRRYQDQVFRFALHMLPSRQDAEDVAQETFIDAYRNIKKFRGEASFRTWLIAIARTMTARWYRRRRIECDLIGVPEPVACSNDVSLEHLEVRSAVAHLPERDRELIVLRYGNQLDLDEISAITGLSRGAVATRLHRARHTLRGALGDIFRQEVCRDEL